MNCFKDTHITGYLRPGINNPRNSEGDFISLKDGRIMFAYSRFNSDSHGDGAPSDIAAIFSDDGGETYSTEPVILKYAKDFGVTNLMSVSLLRMKNGDAGLFYMKKTADGNSECILSRSNDECSTFYEDTKCFPTKCKGYHVMNNNRILRTSSGKLIIPTTLHRASDPREGYYIDERGTAVYFGSDDDGHTWRELDEVLHLDATHTKTGLQEAGVEEMPNGVIYSYFRTDLMVQYESFSYNNGNRWTLPQPSTFTSPASPMKIARNPYTGIYYAIWNPIPNYNDRRKSRYSWGRTPLAIAKSSDCITFSEPDYIEDDPDRGFCYPSIYFPDADTALVAYCSGGEEDKACLCRITLRKIIL